MLLQIEAGTLDMMGDPLPAAQFTDVTTNLSTRTRSTTTRWSTPTTCSWTPRCRTRVRSATSRSARPSTTRSTRRPSCRSATAPASRPTASTRRDLPGYDADCNPYPHDVEKAKALMKEAGLEAGFETTLLHRHDDPDPQIGASIQQDLAAIGIKVKIVSQEFDVARHDRDAAPGTVGWVGWFQDFPDPSDFIDPILSCATAVKGGANAPSTATRQSTSWPRRRKGETDAAKRLAEYQTIQNRIMADAPWVPFRHQEWYTMVSNGPGGLLDPPRLAVQPAGPVGEAGRMTAHALA